MPIMLSMEFAGIGKDKYDAIMKFIGLDKKDAKWPAGLISHTAGEMTGGMCVVDVWENEEAFGKFQKGQLEPAFKKVGGMPQPRVTTAKVCNSWPRR